MKNEKQINILIVDNDPVWANLLGALIEQECGIKPSFAFNGECALKFAATQPVDIILTDTNMAEMSGVELFQRIKKINKVIKVFIFFDQLRGSSLTKKQVLALGADGILNKSEFLKIPDFIRKES
jgi:response regulator RpfG family c-di-GMP phosphodiesterase